MKSPKYSLIIPTYIEQKNIVSLIRKIIAIQPDAEIIIVDDNSPDGTAKEVKNNFKNNPQIKVFIRKNERGLATAILYGIKKAGGEVIIGMDADFNHPPELIPQLIENLKDSDFVVASRFITGGGMDNKFRYFCTYIFNLFLKYLLGFPTMDNMSGFYAIKRNKLNILPLKEIYRGYGEYHLRLVWYARKNHLKIKEVPVFYPKRKHGTSKSNLLKMFFVYLVTAFQLRLNPD